MITFLRALPACPCSFHRTVYDVQTAIFCSENWEDIKDEIKRSNILQVKILYISDQNMNLCQIAILPFCKYEVDEFELQRDSHIFAKRLDSRLETYAKEVDKKVRIFWKYFEIFWKHFENILEMF